MAIPFEEKIKHLKRLDFLADQRDEVFNALAHMVEEVEYKAGQELFHKGDAGGAVFIIHKGSVQIHDGGHIFIELEAGKSFGEYSLVKTERRSASATAKVDSLLLKCSHYHIEEVERKLDARIIDNVFYTLRNIRARMLDKDILEEELTCQKVMIEEQRKELERLNRTKDKFFSIIAHDLRNPFASLIGASDLLMEQMGEMNRDQIKTFVEIINQSAKQGYRLLQNLLQWARMQTESIEWEPRKVDLWDVANDIVILYTSSAENKGIDIRAEVEESLLVWADFNMVNTIIRNLVSNAVKFTPRGGSVRVRSIRQENAIEIWVSDTGVGMSPEDVAKLFRIDVQHSLPGTENEPGSGLGLILCKEFVERHHGKIWVESELGKGSTFKFSLPLSQ